MDGPIVDPLLCYPDPVPLTLQAALRRGGYRFLGAGSSDSADRIEAESVPDGWGGAVVCAEGDLSGAIAFCRHLRRRPVPVAPLVLLVEPAQIAALSLRDDLFDDFCVLPIDADETNARLRHLLWRSGRGLQPEVVEYGPLVLNFETYQAAVAGRVLALTYMEYELLRFFATHPGKVFTRDTLLSRVWGYEYYGGARTVDVHVRRLRAKLGEEHAHLIETVRSVGYRFGQAGWIGARPTPAAGD